MSKLSESIPRALIKNGGVNICGSMEYWRNTWHEEDGAEWAIAKAQINCDQCDCWIDVGELYSIGERMCYCDAPMPVHGIDRVHFYCTDSGKNVKDTAIQAKEDPDAALMKWKYEIIEQNPTINAKEQAFTGLVAIITGEFPSSKEFYKGEVEKNGGFVKDNISPATTHMIVGASGVTQYGQKTGPGSKKYAEGKKKKLIIVDRKWIEDGIANWKITGLSVFNQTPKATTTATTTTTTTTSTTSTSTASTSSTTSTTSTVSTTSTTSTTSEIIMDTESNETEKKRKVEDDGEEQVTKKQKCDDSDYSKLSRKELQSLAKENNIPANAKNEVIIQKLNELKK
jgi:hypothetical protein